MSDDWPTVSVVMPIRNEEDHVARAVAAVLAQDYLGTLEVVVAVAPSADGTLDVIRQLAAEDERIHVVDNPSGGTAAGLNAAIQVAAGTIVARVDGHAELSEGYVRQAVAKLQETGADNVGGVQRAVGTTPMQRAIATAMSSRFGVGDAHFHYGGAEGPTDTVYLGVFRKEALERVGGFDESLVRNQDYELNWRLRDTGGTVWFDPELEVVYRPRSTLRELARQYHEYGRWKRLVVRRDPRSLRWRQLVPPIAVLANVLGIAIGTTVWRFGLLAPLTYAIAAAGAAVAAPAPWRVRWRLPVVFATMHHAWGLGFLRGVHERGEQR